MIKKERHEQILSIIRQRKYCTVNYLAQQLFVAPITIRRDLGEMENAGLISRCFGGATTPAHENREVPFEIRSRSNAPVKAELARRAAGLINDGDVVFLDASSTVSHVADYLEAERNVTVVTNSTLIAEKMKCKHIRCYLTGGMPVENSYALVGSIAQQTLSGLYANICFFSSQGISETGVICDHSEAETTVRQWMIRNAGKKYYLFDSSKLGKSFAFRICDAGQVDGIITDAQQIPFSVNGRY